MVATWLGMPADPPNRSLMSACEVLTWIAFRRIIPQERLHCLFKISYSRWVELPEHAILIALSARSGEFSDGPYCPIRLPPGPWFGSDEFPSRYPHFRKEGPGLLRRIRALRRKETGRLVSYAEVADMLKDEIEDDKRVSAQIEAARVTLLDRAAGGDLVSFGIRAGDDGEPRPGSIHEAIPATHLMHPMIGITEWDMVRVDTSHPVGKWLNLRIPEYAKVQFKTAEVLALWPAATARSPSTAEAPSSPAAPKPIQLDDLPSAWTLMECIAWIMLRDPRVVRNLALPISQRGGQYLRTHTLPDGSRVTVSQTDMKQHEAIDLDLRWAWKLHDELNATGCSSNEAKRQLLAALSNDRVHATGSLPEGARAVMNPADWRGLGFREGDRGRIEVEPIDQTVRRYWSDITMPKAEILAVWASERVTSPTGALPRRHSRKAPTGPDEPRRAAALAAMTQYALEVVGKHGRPPSRDDVAREAKTRTGYPVYLGRLLYRELPSHLRNPARA